MFLVFFNRGFERFVNVLDNEGAVPLHMAARSGNARVVSLLLDNGGLVAAVTFKSTYGWVEKQVLSLQSSDSLRFTHLVGMGPVVYREHFYAPRSDRSVKICFR
jgi:ankyrin repeat protein